jgi:hypothetical protein
MIALATMPEFALDRNRVRDSLAALRLGHDGLEQFVGLLFDELETLREQIDDERLEIDDERHNVREAEARIATERTQWETDRQHWHDTLQKRVVELEQDRLALVGELEAERRRGSELAQASADQQRHFVAERTQLTAQIRELQQRLATGSVNGDGAASALLHSSAENGAGDSVQPREKVRHEAPVDIVHAEELILKSGTGGRHGSTRSPRRQDPTSTAQRVAAAATNPTNADPVMGPLLSQFQKLQKDVARRREKKK